MKTAATLEAQPREGTGKGSARALRREGRIPAVVYAGGKAGAQISLPLKELTLQYNKGAFTSKVITLKVGKDTLYALPRDVQTHPVTDVIEHADFLQVKPGEQIRVFVPVRFTGQDKSPGIKKGGVLNIVRHEVEFFCQPDNIPDFIMVDVAGTNIGDSRHINDIQLPAGISAVIKRNFTVATVAGRSSKLEDELPTTAAATTVEGGASVEGATAEGAAAPGAAPAAEAGKDAKKDAGKGDKK